MKGSKGPMLCKDARKGSRAGQSSKVGGVKVRNNAVCKMGNDDRDRGDRFATEGALVIR